jgi:phosphoribosylformimino-5-aminoimidazole carboxamide ribotide isomerase
MKVIPAVDIMKGKVVRLLRGDPKHSESYEHLGDPVTLARRWEAEGAQIIHVIDLDAALGLGSNIEAIEEIIEGVSVPVQVGGGIRSLDKARAFFGKGIYRVILGSLAFKEPSSVEVLLDEFGQNRIAVALDNLDGVVMVHGWKTSARVTVDDAVTKFSRLGAKFFLVTSVERDGTMSGPDFQTLAGLCRRDIAVIAAGGISGLDDLVGLKRLGVHGVVIGKALYEGTFTLSKALRTVGEE